VKAVGVGATFWRRGHHALMQTEAAGRHDTPTVYARAGSLDIGRGEAVAGNWVRFRLAAADYQAVD
jgi:hypothetical protein